MSAIKFDDLTVEQKRLFSLDGTIPFRPWYFDETNINVDHLYTDDIYSALLTKANQRQTHYYGQTDNWLYQALTDFPIKDQYTLVIGSIMPWYESIALEFGCKHCTVVEYRDQKKELEGITYIKPDDLRGRLFGSIFSISSYEHDGLGRYGDPLNPNGDLESMKAVRGNLKQGGLMYLAVPVGRDEIVWNAHRVYGRIRLPMLIEGWELVGKYGVTKEIWDTPYTNDCPAQPVFVLRKP
jgi:hypothetical protein